MVVSLAGLRDFDELTAKMMLYVLASRPEHELYLSWTGTGANRLAVKVPEWVLAVPTEELRRVTLKHE